MAELNSGAVKRKALELGADLVGVADAKELNRNPPDPKWPQTPERIWKDCRSVIVIAKRIPSGILLSQDLSTRLYVPHIVFNRLDAVSLELSYFIEDLGSHAFPAAQNYTDTALKKGTYAPISLRHAAVEAGLGTLGLNLNLVTRKFGPRVYLQAVLTDAPLDPDGRPENPVCLGPKCGKCLLACPVDAVGFWNIDKRKCSTQAQRYGAAALIRHLHRIIDAESEEAKELVRSADFVNFWQALRTGAGAYAGCLRCMEVCPVGEDYRNLRAPSKIPERADEKVQRLLEMDNMMDEAYEASKTPLKHSARWVLY